MAMNPFREKADRVSDVAIKPASRATGKGARAGVGQGSADPFHSQPGPRAS